jgi:hypothetical protein
MPDQPYRPLLRTQADVEAMWRRLMGRLGFGGHTIWMIVVEDDRPLPQIVEIVETAQAPEAEDVESFGGLLAHVASPGCRFAFLRSRPGGGRPDATDRAWARMLYDACRFAGAGAEVIHLAHDHDVLPIPLDDLLAEPA